MSEREQIVGRFHRQLAGRFVLRQAVAAAALWAFLWGAAILIFKTSIGASTETLLWGLLGFPIAIAVAAPLALRRMPDPAALRAYLDRKGECGGLLMAEAECELGDWERTAAIPELPQVRWRGNRALGFFAMAIASVVLSLLLPARRDLFRETPLDISPQTERLAEQVRVLKEEKILDRNRAEDLKQKLDDLRSQSTGKEPAKALEALDHLKDIVRQTARQAAENSARKANRLGQVDAAAEAVQKAAAAIDPKEMATLIKELAGIAEKALAENGRLSDELAKELAEAIKDGKLSPEQLAKLAAAAKLGKDSIASSARKLFDAKLIDADQLKACEGGQCDGSSLAEFLSKNAGKKSLSEGMQEQFGKGGVDDGGPGNTPLQFGDRSNEAGTKFKEQALTPSELASLKASQLTGVSKAEPKRDAKVGPPQAGGLVGAAAGGGSANTAAVLPQHKAAVGKYFDRTAK